jgi:putative (di)nucleoside polyphosphate hydrolase
MSSQNFRANAGILIFKADKVLIFERTDIPGSWQLPQGGIDVGETPRQAAYREMKEETGLSEDSIKLVSEYPEWLAYELPYDKRKSPESIGQIQRWFIFELLADESAIDLAYDAHQEFNSYRWIDFTDLESITVDFRKPIYRKLSTFMQAL